MDDTPFFKEMLASYCSRRLEHASILWKSEPYAWELFGGVMRPLMSLRSSSRATLPPHFELAHSTILTPFRDPTGIFASMGDSVDAPPINCLVTDHWEGGASMRLLAVSVVGDNGTYVILARLNITNEQMKSVQDNITEMVGELARVTPQQQQQQQQAGSDGSSSSSF
jgi:hypothetical protein